MPSPDKFKIRPSEWERKEILNGPIAWTTKYQEVVEGRMRGHCLKLEGVSLKEEPEPL